MKIHEYSFPWTNLWFLKTEIPIFIYIHHLFMNHILWIYSWIKFMKCLDEPVMNQSWIYHEYSWRVHKSSLSYEFHLAGEVLLLQADGFWLTVRTLLDSCHSQFMQTGSEAITHSWEIMATKNNTWSVSTFAGSEYTPQNNSTSWKTIHHLLFNHGVNDSVNVICLSQTMMPYI